MEEQNSVNEEKDSNTQRQEKVEVGGKVKVGEGAIRKMGKQRVIATKLKSTEVRDTQEREGKIPSAYYKKRTQKNYGKKKNHPKFSNI